MRRLACLVPVVFFLCLSARPALPEEPPSPEAQAVWDNFCPLLGKIIIAFDSCDPADERQFPEKLRKLGFRSSKADSSAGKFQTAYFVLEREGMPGDGPAICLSYSMLERRKELMDKFTLSLSPVSPALGSSLLDLASRGTFPRLERMNSEPSGNVVVYENAKETRRLSFAATGEPDEFSATYYNLNQSWRRSLEQIAM